MNFCPTCGNPILPGENFCPKCGTKVANVTPVSISLGRQLYIYAVSIFLPPLGLVWTFKYWNKEDSFKKVGIIAAVLTVIASIATLWFTFGIIGGIQQQISTYSNLGL